MSSPTPLTLIDGYGAVIDSLPWSKKLKDYLAISQTNNAIGDEPRIRIFTEQLPIF
jgi:hypothetical protein